MVPHSGAGSSFTGSFSTSINSRKSPYDFLSEQYSSQPIQNLQSTRHSGFPYVYRTQSEFFNTEPDRYETTRLNRLLNSDVDQRVTYVGENIMSNSRTLSSTPS